MGKWLTPNSIPEPTLCRLFFIPQEPTIIAAISGALLPLTYSYSWEPYGEVTPDEIAQAMQKMYTDWLESEVCLVGTVVALATAGVPDGMLECDGSLYSRVDYPRLYEVLAAIFIVDADSFRVPDLRGNVVLGAGLGYTAGDTGGEVEHTLNESEIPSHTHTTHGHLSGLVVAPGELPVSVPSIVPDVSGATGGSGAHNNLQPYLVLRYGIITG